MTYILGARCKDGIVLIGDTKVTVDQGADYTYSRKINCPLTNVVMASAGISGMYLEFQNRLISEIQKAERENRARLISAEDFSTLITEIVRDMHETFGDDRHVLLSTLNILYADRITVKPRLMFVNPYGFPENKDITAIGHGAPYGALFIKKMWSPAMTMEETARLGLFIIKFIQDMHLDNSVGFDTDHLPQVFFIPSIDIPASFNETKQSHKKKSEEIQSLFDAKPIKELDSCAVQHLINEVSSIVAKFENFFKEGEFQI